LELHDDDVVVVAQKVVSEDEGRLVALASGQGASGNSPAGILASASTYRTSTQRIRVRIGELSQGQSNGVMPIAFAQLTRLRAHTPWPPR
jgi:hypothetical protein